MTTDQITVAINSYRTKNNMPISKGSFKVLKSALVRINIHIGFYEYQTIPTIPISEKIKPWIPTLKNAIQKAIDLISDDSDFVSFDTGLMVLMCVSTGLRTSEIIQLTLNDLRKLLNNEDIYIRIKKKINRPKIMIISTLVTPKLAIIEKNRTDKLILSSASACLHKFKNLMPDTNVPLGMQAVRSLITTYLYYNASPKIATLFNRHSNANTTNKHYITYDNQ